MITLAAAIPLITSLITAIPKLFTSYKKVKELNDKNYMIDVPIGKDLISASTEEINIWKRDTAIGFLSRIFNKHKKRFKLDDDDVGIFVDFSCVLWKIVNYKARKAGKA